MLGLSDDDDDDEDDVDVLAQDDLSSETSSSPEIDNEPEQEMANENNDKEPMDQIEEIIPTHHPNDILHGQEDHDQEDEIVVNELTHDEKVDKLEDTIKILQQQMAEGNDHIEYELKMRKKEEKALRYVQQWIKACDVKMGTS